MALDLFQTSDKSEFWGVFGATAAVTYVAAAVGLATIYRKGVIDILHPLVQKTARKKTESDGRGSTGGRKGGPASTRPGENLENRTTDQAPSTSRSPV